MRLPGEKRTEFCAHAADGAEPAKRDMIDWLAARCDQADYGKLDRLHLSQGELALRPVPIEALINQNRGFPADLAGNQWARAHSRTLLVVPIENSLLYVTPLYLRAQTHNTPHPTTPHTQDNSPHHFHTNGRHLRVYGGQLDGHGGKRRTPSEEGHGRSFKVPSRRDSRRPAARIDAKCCCGFPAWGRRPD